MVVEAVALQAPIQPLTNAYQLSDAVLMEDLMGFLHVAPLD